MTMKGLNCNETLLITERQTVEIDYCLSCRGVWLEKGELNKLLEVCYQPKVDRKQTYNHFCQQSDHTKGN